MSKQNKFSKLAILSLLGIMGLTACNNTTEEVYSKPSNYESPIVTIDGNDEKIHNDILKIVYDSIHDGSLKEKVLEKILYKYAESVLGVYNGVTQDKDDTSITLQKAYISFTKTGEVDKINTFIKEHKAYWLYNEDGKHVDAAGTVIEDDADFTPCDAERQYVVSKWEAIENRIAETLYTRALSGTYTVKKLFREAKFVRSLHEAGEKVDYASSKTVEPVLVPYTVEKQDIFMPYETSKHYLHREFYQDSYGYEGDDFSTFKYTYVEDVIIPAVYNDLLIEQYLLNEDIAAIRNSRARKINVIKIEKYHDFTNNADMLVKQLVKEIYAAKPADTDAYVATDVDVIEERGRTLFEKYAKISKGLYNDIQADADAQAIVELLNQNASDVYEKATLGRINYYKHTAYGDLVEEYSKLKDAISDGKWEDIDESLYSEYTSSGTTTVEEGFSQKEIAISQTQSITKGWYIQNKTPSLDSAGKINDRLFKLSVANAKIEVGAEGEVDADTRTANLNALAEVDRFVKEGSTWTLREKASDKENKFLCSINGAYYLKFEGQYAGDDWKNDIVYDDGSAYYIVQVLEATKDTKLRASSNNAYSKTRGQSFYDSVIDEVGKILGETGNYATVSKEYWLKKMDLKFHDQTIYDYFKENYPDLFK